MFDVDANKIIDFTDLMRCEVKDVCDTDVVVTVKKTKDDQQETLRRIISEQAAIKPVIVFVKNATECDWLVKTCKDLSINFFKAMDSPSLKTTRMVITTQSSGLVIVKSDFYRGADLRFK